jgi:hypothetical protein
MEKTLNYVLQLLRKNTITQIIVSWVLGTIGIIWNDNSVGTNKFADALTIIGVGVFALIIILWVLAGLLWSIIWIIKKVFKSNKDD